MSRRPKMCAAVLLFTAFLPSLARAQAGRFVLLGEQPLEQINLPDERRFVAPITTPYFHENSFVTTDVRAWYVFHKVPSTSLLGGGEINDYALQLRVALTDNLQLVAYKDGYIDFNTPAKHDDGYNDLAAGLKWAFIQDWKNDFHAALGAGYQFAIGDPGALQNDQEVRGWLSVDKGFGRLHLGACANALFSVGNQDAVGNSDRFIWNAHIDYFVCKWFSPVFEMTGYHVFSQGRNHPLPFSGLDVANLGGGDSVVNVGVGAEIRPLDNLGARFAYETNVADGVNLIAYRWTFSLIYSF